MSNVHLSGAAALERLSARRALVGHGRSPVCRSLFGPVDHEELGRELRERLREMGEDDQRRWDYNFQTDTPLPGPGRLHWEEVEAGAVPAFYRETLQVGRCRVPLRRAAAACGPAGGARPPASQISLRGEKGRRSPRRRRNAPPAARRPPPPCRLSSPPASGSGEPDFCTTAPTGEARRRGRRDAPEARGAGEGGAASRDPPAPARPGSGTRSGAAAPAAHGAVLSYNSAMYDVLYRNVLCLM
nr:cyclin-dependent kinase inhibitor 1C [Lonchura striata domestica]